MQKNAKNAKNAKKTYITPTAKLIFWLREHDLRHTIFTELF